MRDRRGEAEGAKRPEPRTSGLEPLSRQVEAKRRPDASPALDPFRPRGADKGRELEKRGVLGSKESLGVERVMGLKGRD